MKTNYPAISDGDAVTPEGGEDRQSAFRPLTELATRLAGGSDIVLTKMESAVGPVTAERLGEMVAEIGSVAEWQSRNTRYGSVEFTGTNTSGGVFYVHRAVNDETGTEQITAGKRSSQYQLAPDWTITFYDSGDQGYGYDHSVRVIVTETIFPPTEVGGGPTEEYPTQYHGSETTIYY